MTANARDPQGAAAPGAPPSGLTPPREADQRTQALRDRNLKLTAAQGQGGDVEAVREACAKVAGDAHMPTITGAAARAYHRDVENMIRQSGDWRDVNVELYIFEAASRLRDELAAAIRALDLSALAGARVETLEQIALGILPHRYAGECPDALDVTRRDPACQACAALRGQP